MIKLFFLVPLALMMSGCGRDTLVNGPYLIGADPKPITNGHCYPPGSARYQYVRAPDFEVCQTDVGFMNGVHKNESVDMDHNSRVDLKRATKDEKSKKRVGRSAW